MKQRLGLRVNEEVQKKEAVKVINKFSKRLIKFEKFITYNPFQTKQQTNDLFEIPSNFEQEFFHTNFTKKPNPYYFQKIKLEVDTVELENIPIKKKFLKNNYIVGEKAPKKKQFRAPKPIKSKNTEPSKEPVFIDQEVDHFIQNNLTL